MKALQPSNQESRAVANNPSQLQTKLAVGEPGDALEREADAVAEKVVAGEQSIQRKCAACTEEDQIQRQPEEEEDELQMKPLAQMKTSSRGSGSETTPWVEQQINSSRSSGQKLPKQTRSFMESGIGAGFQNVKVHTDSTAVQMNRELGAKAFTVGNDIFFNSGQYSPETGDGKKLLAHELTHTVQQGASQQVIQRHAMAFSQDEEMIQKTEDEEEESGSPAAGSQPQTNPSCSHNASGLSWADFTGSVPSASPYGAATHFDFTSSQVNGADVIVANFLPSSSWVKSQFGQAAQRAQNGCSAPITACEEFMQAEEDAGRTGATYNLSQPTGCVASIGPNPSATANNKGECESVLGTECDRVALLESSRLLRHEQYHYALACVLAGKGTAAIAGGANAQSTLTSVRSTANTKTTEYDDQTVHGCDTSQQSAWQTAIDNGLPNVTV